MDIILFEKDEMVKNVIRFAATHKGFRILECIVASLIVIIGGCFDEPLPDLEEYTS